MSFKAVSMTFIFCIAISISLPGSELLPNLAGKSEAFVPATPAVKNGVV